MDERVEGLLHDFPEIFEERPPQIGELEDDWVIIDVPIGRINSGETQAKLNVDAIGVSEDDFLSDLDRFEYTSYPENEMDESDSSGDILVSNILRSGIDIDPDTLSEITRRRRPRAIDDLKKRVKGQFPGSPSGLPTGGLVPPPDALAFYLPFHIFPDMWGIYLLDVGVESLAIDLRQIIQLLGQSVPKMAARRISRVFLFHHEAYHCAVESFSIRCELASRKPVYRTGTRELYKRGYVQDEPHEETLATAYGLRKVRDEIKLPKRDKKAAVEALKIYMKLCPPEYREGVCYIDNDRFDEWERAFIEKVMRTCSSRPLSASAWNIGTYMMSPLLQRNRKYSWICKRADFRERSKLAVHYFRRRDIVSCLKKLTDAYPEPGGKHDHIVRTVNKAGHKSNRRTQLPSGEVHKGTLSGILKDLDLDLNVHSFREECRRVGKPV